MTRNQTIFAAVIAICAAFVLSFLSQKLLAKPSSKFAVVDLTGVLSSSQEQAIKAIADSSTPPEVRQRAIESAKLFGVKVESATSELSRQCGCVVLMKEAVVSGDLPDLTSELIAKLRAN